METSANTIAVAGATGLQGGAVARRLIADGWRVRALTRNPQGEAARELAALGAEPTQADLEDKASLLRACSGAYGVFSVQDFWEHGYDREILQGVNLADAARAEGATHFVYASVGGTERTEGLGIRHFDSKAVIEAHIESSMTNFTVVRPVSFFENFTMPASLRRLFDQGILAFPFPGDRPFQLVAVADEADLVALTFADPERFRGMKIELASDRCRLDDLAREIANAIGRDVSFLEVASDRLAAITEQMVRDGMVGVTKVGPSLVQQLVWNNASPSGGWNADIPMLRDLLPSLRSTREWVSSIDWPQMRRSIEAP